MQATNFERAELLRAEVQTAAGDTPARLVDLAAGDAAAVQSAWSAFVPYLAHPAMAGPAGGAMAVLDRAATVVATRTSITT